ncbi:MAG: hypothetical protein QN166_05935 [Armatimonadota bacterium]|nr:hypothetical protein [Armatimonadota bacterium]
MARPFLKAEGLTKVYPGGVRALQDVSFEVARGEFVVVIGLSGHQRRGALRRAPVPAPYFGRGSVRERP